SLGTLQILEKQEDPKRFEMKPFLEGEEWNSDQVKKYEDKLFTQLPFYKNLVYSENSQTIQTALYLQEDIVNSAERKIFVTEVLQPLIENFEKENNLEVYVSGMPYIRTLNSQNIIDEI